jgi:hypothetical protein
MAVRLHKKHMEIGMRVVQTLGSCVLLIALWQTRDQVGLDSLRQPEISSSSSAGSARGRAELQATGPVLWSADFESGNISQWYAPSSGPTGNYGGGEFTTATGYSQMTQSRAHTGRWSLAMTLSATPPESAVRMFRWLEPRAYTKLYYSVWYYFPQQYRVSRYWNVFQWKSKRPNGAVDPFFVLDVSNHTSGTMSLSLVDWQKQVKFGQSVTDVPIGQWFNVEAMYTCAGDATGHVTIWQDGAMLFNLANVQTRYADGDCQWSVDNYSDGLSPAPATIYIDDAVISLRPPR